MSITASSRTEAPFFIIQRALPRLRNGGRIINISSASTRIATTFVPYAMTKGAIDVLGHTLPRSWEREVSP